MVLFGLAGADTLLPECKLGDDALESVVLKPVAVEVALVDDVPGEDAVLIELLRVVTALPVELPVEGAVELDGWLGALPAEKAWFAFAPAWPALLVNDSVAAIRDANSKDDGPVAVALKGGVVPVPPSVAETPLENDPPPPPPPLCEPSSAAAPPPPPDFLCWAASVSPNQLTSARSFSRFDPCKKSGESLSPVELGEASLSAGGGAAAVGEFWSRLSLRSKSSDVAVKTGKG